MSKIKAEIWGREFELPLISVPQVKERVVAVMCDFKFDMENGLAIVFENEKFKEVGYQDLVL